LLSAASPEAKACSHNYSDGFRCYGPDLDQRLPAFSLVAECNNTELENIEESVQLAILLG
jgi:hypothetical protein